MSEQEMLARSIRTEQVGAWWYYRIIGERSEERFLTADAAWAAAVATVEPTYAKRDRLAAMRRKDAWEHKNRRTR
jgi:hypothetical protein